MKTPRRIRQKGITLLLFVFLLFVIGTTAFVTTWNSNRARQELIKSSAMAMRQAKEALIADAIKANDINSTGYLALPDIGVHIGVPTEGYKAGSFTNNATDYPLLGKLPWLSLDIEPLRDQNAGCLWYVVSGRFKKNPPTEALNWDTAGQIDVIDASGAMIAQNIVAMVIAPGPPLAGQDRSLAAPAYTRCGGNYQASNYLDPANSANALAGQFNYFAGSTNNRVASNAANKSFVMANNQHFNDQFLLITVDDIFRPIIRRSDFSAQISSLLSDSQLATHLQGLLIAGPKGTNNLDCAVITASVANQSFCKNWKEMLFVTQLPSPPSPSTCNRVIIFAGQKQTGQSRITSAEKSNKANYLEAPYLNDFVTPVALSNNFANTSPFNPNQPWLDIVKCIPAP